MASAILAIAFALLGRCRGSYSMQNVLESAGYLGNFGSGMLQNIQCIAFGIVAGGPCQWTKFMRVAAYVAL
jgi:hypothetical protein